VCTVLAAVDMTTQRRSATNLDRCHDAPLGEAPRPPSPTAAAAGGSLFSPHGAFWNGGRGDSATGFMESIVIISCSIRFGGIESVLRNDAGHLAGIALFDPVLWEIYLNLEREPGAGEANHDIAVRTRVVAKAVAPGARRRGDAAG
jgi:hypothetical protein